jgi:outer membrane protein OmpU
MKMKYIAIAVAAAIPASLVSAATVFENDDSVMNIGGRAEVRGNISDGNKSADDNSSYADKSRVRLNIDGTKVLNDDVSFTGRYEFEMKADGEGGIKVTPRHLYAGVETSNGGDVYYGQQNNAVTYLTDFTDACEVFCGDINEYTVATQDRAANVLRYAITTDYGLTFQVDGNFNSEDQSNGYGAVLAYQIPVGLEIGIGYAASDETYGNGSETDTSTALILAARYANDNGVSAALMYQGGDISFDRRKGAGYDSFDAFLGYAFDDNAINFTYSYFAAESLDELDFDYASVEYARYFDNVAFYGAYKLNFASEGHGSEGSGTDDELMLGMRYAF